MKNALAAAASQPNGLETNPGYPFARTCNCLSRLEPQLLGKVLAGRSLSNLFIGQAILFFSFLTIASWLGGLAIGLRMNMFAKYENFMARMQIKNELFFIAAQVKSAIEEQV